MFAATLRRAIGDLQRTIPDVFAANLDPADHRRSRGTACGSVFKVQSPSHGIAYIYPNGTFSGHVTPEFLGAIQRWIGQAQESFDPILSRARCVSRTTAFKEELMAAAWHPRRVEAYFLAGVDLETL